MLCGREHERLASLVELEARPRLRFRFPACDPAILRLSGRAGGRLCDAILFPGPGW